MTGEEWVSVPNWDKFQHYKDRNPPWIRVYTELNSRSEWLMLGAARRGLLVTVWLEYARSGALLTTKQVRMLGGPKTRYADIEALSDAGFITLSASKPLAPSASNPLAPHARAGDARDRGEERREELPPYPLSEGELIECKKCGETIRVGAGCWACGATPRAAGSNPRAIDERQRATDSEHRDELHAQLLARAWQIAAGWNGGGSDVFDEQLDELEREIGSRLTAGERMRIWDGALTGL